MKRTRLSLRFAQLGCENMAGFCSESPTRGFACAAGTASSAATSTARGRISRYRIAHLTLSPPRELRPECPRTLSCRNDQARRAARRAAGPAGGLPVPRRARPRDLRREGEVRAQARGLALL